MWFKRNRKDEHLNDYNSQTIISDEYFQDFIKRKMNFINLKVDKSKQERFQQYIHTYSDSISRNLLENVKHILGEGFDKEHWRNYINNFLRYFKEYDITNDFIETQKEIVNLLIQSKMQPDWLLGAGEVIIDAIYSEAITSSDKKDIQEDILYFHKVMMLHQMVWTELYTKHLVSTFSGGVSELVYYNAQIDQVKGLLESLDKQVNFSQEIQYKNQEINQTVEEVATSSTAAADFSHEAAQKATAGKEVISGALEEMSMLEGQYNEVGQAMTQFSSKITDMQEMVSLIRGIADQTNLLALNANIEAARAGEHGLGFSVVAQEVRKLSEHSKQSVDQITALIQQLVEEANRISAWISTTGQIVSEGVHESKNALGQLDEMVQSINQISSSVESIAAASQEQAASISEVTLQNNQIVELSHVGQEKGKATGQSIYKLSKMSESLRKQIDEFGIEVNEKELLNLAKTDHLLWKWRIYNMLLGFEHVDPNSINDEKECRLGKWYYSEKAEKFKHLSVFQKMENPHRYVHQTAKEAAIAYSKGDIALAEQKLSELNHYSSEIIDLLGEIESSLS